MCLGIPGKVIDVNDQSAVVDFWGTKRRVLLMTVDQPVKPGDYVLTHVGFAIRRIPEEEIAETLAFYDALVNAARTDLMAQDVLGEMEANK